jgi:hypothetical protein
LANDLLVRFICDVSCIMDNAYSSIPKNIYSIAQEAYDSENKWCTNRCTRYLGRYK